MNIVLAVGLTVGLFGLVVLLYRMNKNTPVPKGCENLHPDCQACGISDCAIRDDMMRKIKEELNHGDH